MTQPIVNALPLPEGNLVSFILTPYNNYELSVALGRGYYIVGIEDAKVHISDAPGGMPAISCGHLMGKSVTDDNHNTTEVKFTPSELRPTLNEVKAYVAGGKLNYSSVGKVDREAANVMLHVTVKFMRIVDDELL